ncbi:MAG: SH3 domain-containing protein [Bacteroidota bacterium]
MKFIPLFFLLPLALLTACGGGDTTDSTVTSSTDPAEDKAAAKADDPNEPVYAWVENLNLRDSPSTSGKVIASVQPKDALERVEQSATTEAIVLRGVLYDEPWIKVKTAAGEEGWVFGGAVKRKDELKGNAPIDEKKFRFPVFGEFDLNEWTYQSVEIGDSEGDVNGENHYYRRGDQMLLIRNYESEYGYGYVYVLKTTRDQVLKERFFDFSNDVLELTETVKDYTTDPAREYSRSQKTKLASRQLNAKPVMLSGPWTEKNISGGEQATQGRIGFVDYSSCGKVDPEDTGCSCSFRSVKADYKTEILYADFGTNACMTIDGKGQALTGYQQSHSSLNDGRPWIVLGDSKSTLFGEEAPFGEYELIVERLTQALLTLDRLPDQVPIQNNMTAGMMVREVRDMGTDAIAKARELKKNGERGSAVYYQYANDQYTVIIKAEEDRSRTLDSGRPYRGEITITTKGGTLIERSTVWGDCGC